MANDLYFVEIKSAKLFGYHGIGEKEKTEGNNFLVSLRVEFVSEKKTIQHLADTINYADLFHIVEEEFKQPYDLLETLASVVLDKVKIKFQNIVAAKIKIEKQNPPIKNFNGRVLVRLKRKYF